MSPPMYRDCACGHLGQQHRADGSCSRCECTKFVHPVRRYFPESSASNASEPNRRPIKQKQMGARPETR